MTATRSTKCSIESTPTFNAHYSVIRLQVSQATIPQWHLASLNNY